MGEAWPPTTQAATTQAATKQASLTQAAERAAAVGPMRGFVVASKAKMRELVYPLPSPSPSP